MIEHSQTADSKIMALQGAVLNDPGNSILLQAYLDEAVATEQTAQAGEFLNHLLDRQPWDHLIRKRFIANCLQQKNYPRAMEEIETLVAFSVSDDPMIDSALAVRDYVGPRTIESKTEPGPTLSLCMIVKNEQAFLGPCLNSIKTLVDEIILIDTGSSDRSSDMGRIFGASVYTEKWREDFSAVRNISLEKAQGDWVLILDADEIIAREDHGALRQLICGANGHGIAYAIETRNYSNLANALNWQANDRSYPQHETGKGWFPTTKVRLFPRSDKIRFSYPVHELVEPSLRAQGINIEVCRVPVHHYGHLNETKNYKKAEHYFNLGYTKLEQLGDDMTAIRELAVQAGQLGYWKESIELWHRLLALSPKFGEAYANLAGAYWQMGKYEQGFSYAQKSIRINPDIKEGYYNLGVNLLMRGQAAEAVEVLAVLIQRHPQYLAAEFMLWASLILSGQHPKGLATLTALEMRISKQELKIAIDDLVAKLDRNTYSKGIGQLLNAAGMEPVNQCGNNGELC